MNTQKQISFSQIRELDEANRIRFYEFKELNDLINRNPLLTYEDLYRSYVKVILDIPKYPNYDSQCSELDFQVMYLIHQAKVPLNRVIDFALLKFWKVEQKPTREFWLSWFIGSILRL